MVSVIPNALVAENFEPLSYNAAKKSSQKATSYDARPPPPRRFGPHDKIGRAHV